VLQSIPRTGFAASKEDVTDLHRRAIGLLESVRAAWKDKKTDPTREALLLTLARLYENDQPEKALACLQAVHDIYTQLRETDEETMVPLQLLNNMATFHWHNEKYDLARQLYQTALSSIPELKEKDDSADTDALATTLTYNLARCEEAAGNLDEATKQYEQLLTRHDDYVDANMRLAYMALRRGGEEGPKRIQRLMQSDGSNLEVRALYGWYLGKQKRKTAINIAEDPEQRHYKHSLQYHDKHDRYSLTGMGNLYLLTAREMRRDTEGEKEKRRKTYEKAVEFFDKALQLDPKNAYAAQGVAIAMVEDRKDLKSAVQVFTKVKETLARDAHALVNLGHCLAGLEQWGRAIENVSLSLFCPPPSFLILITVLAYCPCLLILGLLRNSWYPGWMLECCFALYLHFIVFTIIFFTLYPYPLPIPIPSLPASDPTTIILYLYFISSTVLAPCLLPDSHAHHRIHLECRGVGVSKQQPWSRPGL
jgi:RNA polymerase-associated protein CTR9